MTTLTTIAAVRQWLNIKTPDHDELLQRLVEAGSAYVESWLQRRVLEASYTEVRNGPGGSSLVLRNWPVVAITSLKINWKPVLMSAAGSDGWVLDGDRGILRLRGYTFTKDTANVEVVYTAGYATVPADLEQAVIEIIGRKFKSMDHIGIQSKGLAGESISFSQADMNAEVKRMLVGYQRGGV